VDPRALVPEVKREDYRPELICAFCCEIKAFKSVAALWSHFVHWHNTAEGEVHTKVIVSNDQLLEDVRRTANLWRTY
jgi:hypothetical protein